MAGIIALSFNMRAAITSLPPVYPELARAGISPATEAALAAMPVLSFAVFSGSGAVLARKFGEERVLGMALVLLAAGLGLRSLAPGVLLFPGTVVAGCAIALMNVLLPSLVKRRMPERAGLLIGLYLMSLTAGAVLGAVIAVPVFTAAGSSEAAVRLTLGMWALPALAAGLVWLPQLRFRTIPDQAGPDAAGPPGGRGVRAMSRRALAWQVAAFTGTQSLSYYATLSWFPSLLRDHGLSAVQAGNLLALMNLGNAITGLAAPVIAHRVRDQRPLAAAAIVMIMAGLAGVGFGPAGAATAFMLLLGLGQGGAFGLSVFFFTARAADGPTAASLSGFAQATGYLVAITGPLLIGFLHSATGGWAASVWVLLAVGVVQLSSGLLAGRARTISAG